MNFFKTLSSTGINDVIIQFAKSEGQEITIIVSPKNIIRNNPLLQVKPIVITGTPEEVDVIFEDTVVKALAVAQQLHDIMEANKPKQVKPAVIQKPKAVKKEPVAAEPKITSKKIKEVETILENVVVPEPLVGATIEERYEAFEKQTVPVVATKKEAKPIEIKINNEKPLKDFTLTLKTDAEWAANADKIEALYSLLSPVELGNPMAKKVRIDLDIKMRKAAQIKAARDKMMGIVPVPPIGPGILPKIEEVDESIVTPEMMVEEELLEAKATRAVMEHAESKVIPFVPAPVESFNSFENKDEVLPPPPPLTAPLASMYALPVPFDEEEEEGVDDSKKY